MTIRQPRTRMLPKMKSQWVRVIDVTLLGPGMMYAGARKSNLPPFIRLGLFVSGALTIAYNGKNWLEVQKQSPAGIQEVPVVAGINQQGTC